MQQHLFINYITETVIALQIGQVNVARKKLIRVLTSTDAAPAVRDVVEWIADRLLRANMPADTQDEMFTALTDLQRLYDGRIQDLVTLLEFLENKYFNSCMYNHAEWINQRLSMVDTAPKQRRIRMLASTYSALGRDEEAVCLLRSAQCMTIQ